MKKAKTYLEDEYLHDIQTNYDDPALMRKVCNYTLYNCKSVTELQHEADEDCSVTCTSTLQRWHQPRVEGTTSCPIMEVPVSKTQSEGEHKSSGITCHLYEARRIDRKSKLNDFLEGTIN